MIGFNCLKAAELMQGYSLLLTTQFAGLHGTHKSSLRIVEMLHKL